MKIFINTFTTITTVLLMSSSLVFAGEMTIPHEFIAGEKAVAEEVNANFSRVKNAVDDNFAAINANTERIDANADAIDENTEKIDIVMVPKGGIIMWSGSIDDIPSGWALCDGTNDTPDLLDRFILGVSDQEEPGSTGGSSSHSHTMPRVPVSFGWGNTFQGNDREVGFEIRAGQYHFVMNRYYYNPKWWKWAPGESGEGYLSGSPYYSLHTVENTTTVKEALPPYYKLAFIMRK